MLKLAFFCTILLLLNFSSIGGQALILPSSTTVSRGSGACSDIEVSAVSDSWRILKGNTVNVIAVQQWIKHPALTYSWSVSNGTILSGQSTPKIEVKAGTKRTKGFINASGFIGVRLVVSHANDQSCFVESSTEIMVGRFGESRANVYDLTLAPSEVRLPCKNNEPSIPDSTQNPTLVNVDAQGSDAENDVITFSYRVTGGKIIGTGPQVKWDLSNVSPGTYEIVAGADDGCGICGSTVFRRIVVKDCSPSPEL